MAKARKPKKRLPTAVIIAVLGLMVLAAAGIYIAAPRFVDEIKPRIKPAKKPLELDSKKAAELLAKVTLLRMKESPLAGAGQLLSTRKRPASGLDFYSIRWKAIDTTSMILAEKAVSEAWYEVDPDVKVMVSYAEDGEPPETRLMAVKSGKALVELTLSMDPEPAGSNTPVENPEPDDTLRPEHGSHGEIAIIIDDIGNNNQFLRSLLAIGVPLTYSVLPDAREAAEANAILEASGAAVMLHMPMEPESYPENYPGDGALLIGMDREEIDARVLAALAKVPGAEGVNNHMGSAFTADRDAMSAMFEVIAKRDMFFIDSRTTVKTVAFRLARKMGIPAAERNVFLDHDLDPRKIRAKVMEAARLADKKGYAIVIGHPHPETVAVLAETLPELAAKGYRFVPVRELVR